MDEVILDLLGVVELVEGVGQRQVGHADAALGIDHPLLGQLDQVQRSLEMRWLASRRRRRRVSRALMIMMMMIRMTGGSSTGRAGFPRLRGPDIRGVVRLTGGLRLRGAYPVGMAIGMPV